MSASTPVPLPVSPAPAKKRRRRKPAERIKLGVILYLLGRGFLEIWRTKWVQELITKVIEQAFCKKCP